MNRKRRAEKQNAGYDPARKRSESPAGFRLQSAAAAEQSLALLISEVTGEPGAARCSLFGLIDVVHCREIPRSVSRRAWKGYNTLVPRELHKRERRKKLTQSRKTPRLKKVIGEAAGAVVLRH